MAGALPAFTVARILLAGWGDIPALQGGIPPIVDQAEFAPIVAAVLAADWDPDSLGGELKRWMLGRTGSLTHETCEDLLPGTDAGSSHRSIHMILSGSAACELPQHTAQRSVRVNKLMTWVRGAVRAAARSWCVG